MVIHVVESNLSAGMATHDTQQECRRPLHSLDLELIIPAPLKPVGGVGVQTVIASPPGYGQRAEKGALKEDIFGNLADATVFAAHTAGECQRSCVIGDHQRIGFKA